MLKRKPSPAVQGCHVLIVHPEMRVRFPFIMKKMQIKEAEGIDQLIMFLCFLHSKRNITNHKTAPDQGIQAGRNDTAGRQMKFFADFFPGVAGIPGKQQFDNRFHHRRIAENGRKQPVILIFKNSPWREKQ